MNAKDSKDFYLALLMFSREQEYRGYRQARYFDKDRKPLVGIGFRLDSFGAKTKIEALGVSYDNVLEGRGVLNHYQIKALYLSEYMTAIQKVREVISSFDRLSLDIQGLLVGIMTEIGYKDFREMVDFVIAVSCKDYSAMADSLKKTEWYKTSRRKDEYMRELMLRAKRR